MIILIEAEDGAAVRVVRVEFIQIRCFRNAQLRNGPVQIAVHVVPFEIVARKVALAVQEPGGPDAEDEQRGGKDDGDPAQFAAAFFAVPRALVKARRL